MYFLKPKLNALRRTANPSREFKARLLSQLEPRVAYRQHALRFAAVGMASIALLFGTGTGVYAYESPSVSDGHILYPIKRGMEQVEQRFASTSEQRADFHAKLMRRRIMEAERLDGAQERIPRILESASSELDRTVAEITGDDAASPEARRRIIERLSESSDRYERVRSRVREGKNFSPPSAEQMRERLKALRAAPSEVKGSE